MRAHAPILVALVVGCSAPVPTPSDAAAVDAALDAPRCGPCDDGDPTTTDACVVDRCEHRRCESDAACDDGDLQTTDRCVIDLDTATWTCGHANAAGDCETAADCFDDVACTRDSCGLGARCRHGWIPGCEAEPMFTLRTCPAEAAEGGTCLVDATSGLNYDCRQGDDPCADWLHCVGNTFGTRYVRVETVRPGCDAGGCPATLPAGACTPTLYCDYGDGLAPGRIYCDCWDRMNATIEWSCADDEPCPRTPPADGDPVDHSSATGHDTCFYGDYRCTAGADWTWECATNEPMSCPLVAPASGDTCTLPSDCRYYGPETPTDPVTTYRGDCTCDGAHWACTPNAAADCPATQPRPGTALEQCSPSAGNQHCWYPPSDGSDLWTRCHCDAPFDPNLWMCEQTVHY